jgi:hypothetical protein
MVACASLTAAHHITNHGARNPDVYTVVVRLLLVLWVACDGPVANDAGTDAAIGAIARFDLTDDELGAAPYPNDVLIDSESPRVFTLPVRASHRPRLDAVRELLARRRGFCGTCNTYFGIEGALDPTSVPASAAPGDVATIDDAIVMIDLPARTFIPLRVEHQPWSGLIAVRPVRGVVLRRGRVYAVALTDRLRAADGSPLGAAPGFITARAGGGFAPALEAFAELGLDAEHIVSLAVYTIDDPTRHLIEARALVHAAPAPVAIVDRSWTTAAELDALLGIPSEDRPGIDVPPRAGQEGTSAIRHTNVAAVIAGRFRAPRLVEGEGTEIGAPRYDGDRLAAGDLQDVPFVLIVPSGDPSDLPVVVHHHGFNASRVTGFVLADSVGHAAVLSIDAFQHGARAHTQEDLVHAMRGGVAGPDGFPETDVAELSARVFGLSGAADGMQLFPGYPLAAFLQFAADAMGAIRLAREGDASALAAIVPGLSFDPDRIAYAGNSMGSVVGVSVMTVERDAGAFVLDVQPGSMIESLVEAAEFRPLTENVFVPVLGIEGDFDEVSRSLIFDPMIDLARWALEPVDPLGLAPYLFLDPVAGGPRPDVLFQLASLDQLAAPPPVQSMIAAAGVPGVGTFELAEIAPITAPVSANFEGGITVAAYRFDPAAHGMLEILEQPSTYEPPLLPPLVPREPPITVQNPIREVHAQIEAFLRARHETGRAEIR